MGFFKFSILCLLIVAIHATMHQHANRSEILSDKKSEFLFYNPTGTFEGLALLAKEQNEENANSTAYANETVGHRRTKRSLTDDDTQTLYGSSKRTPFSVGPSNALCKPGAFYCGWELSPHGYTNVDSNTIYQCDADQDGLYYTQCVGSGARCMGGRNVISYCPCSIGGIYCGYELRMMNWNFDTLNDHNLYRCDQSHLVTSLGTCPHRCEGKTNSAQCSNTASTVCGPGLKYCGYEMGARTFTPWKMHGLYECNASGTSGSKIETCPSGCVANDNSFCNRGRIAWKPSRSKV